MLKISYQLISLVVCCLSISSDAAAFDCSRKNSKIVRTLINDIIHPIYEERGTKIPNSCPMLSSRDMFGHQEANKFEEAATKWVCNFCGKSFYEERFLDLHFMNRHPESLLQTDSAVCLADLCDVFRCNVVTMATDTKSSYWKRALCREEELQQTQTKCLEMINSCLPENIDVSQISEIRNELNTTLCMYLTCDSYWVPHKSQMSPMTLAYYMLATIILLLGLAVYYLVLHTQLSHNPPKLLRKDDEDSEPIVYPSSGAEIRQRRSSAFT